MKWVRLTTPRNADGVKTLTIRLDIHVKFARGWIATIGPVSSIGRHDCYLTRLDVGVVMRISFRNSFLRIVPWNRSEKVRAAFAVIRVSERLSWPLVDRCNLHGNGVEAYRPLLVSWSGLVFRGISISIYIYSLICVIMHRSPESFKKLDLIRLRWLSSLLLDR